MAITCLLLQFPSATSLLMRCCLRLAFRHEISFVKEMRALTL